MKIVACALLCCWLSLPASSQRFAQDSAAISQLLMRQQADWNRGDIPAFMEGYWKSDRLTFTGAGGITYGWQATYQRYLRTYDSPEKMGQLQFTLLEFRPLGKQYFSVIGKWQLRRTVGDIGGHFTLLLRRFRQGWLIIADHTS